jgi:hypothetical protein
VTDDGTGLFRPCYRLAWANTTHDTTEQQTL